MLAPVETQQLRWPVDASGDASLRSFQEPMWTVRVGHVRRFISMWVV